MDKAETGKTGNDFVQEELNTPEISALFIHMMEQCLKYNKEKVFALKMFCIRAFHMAC